MPTAKRAPKPAPKADSTAYPTVDTWAHARVLTLDLDESYKVDFEVPDLETFIALGTIPNPLRPIAERIEYQGVEPDKLSPEDRLAYAQLQGHIIATGLRRPNLVKECGSVDAAVDWVLTKMPPGHRQKLWAASVHMVTDPEVIKTLAAMLPFRDGGSGDPLSAGGAGEESAA